MQPCKLPPSFRCRSRKYFKSKACSACSWAFPGNLSRSAWTSSSICCFTCARFAVATCLAKAKAACSFSSVLPFSMFEMMGLKAGGQSWNEFNSIVDMTKRRKGGAWHIISKYFQHCSTLPCLNTEMPFGSAFSGTKFSSVWDRSASTWPLMNCASKPSFISLNCPAGATSSSFARKNRKAPQFWCKVIASLNVRAFFRLWPARSWSPMRRCVNRVT